MTLPAASYFTDPDRKNGEAKQAQDDILEVVRTALQPAQNLADLADVPTALENLGLDLAPKETSGTTKAVAGTDTTTAMSPADGVAQALSNPIWGVAGGTGDAITLTIAKAPQTALADGMHFRCRATAANTGAATLNVTLGTTATGAKNVYKLNGTALVAGDIPGANAECDFVYNSTLNGGAGGYTLLNPAVSSSLPSQTGNDGKVLKTSGGAALWDSAVNAGTSVATTSGTSNDLTGIPAWARRISIICDDVSSNGSSVYLLQLGAGSVQTSGYKGTVAQCYQPNGLSASGLYTAGFGLASAMAASDTLNGEIRLTKSSGNTWVISGSYSLNGTTTAFIGGKVALSGTLDRVRLTTVNGTDIFDLGAFVVIVE